MDSQESTPSPHGLETMVAPPTPTPPPQQQQPPHDHGTVAVPPTQTQPPPNFLIFEQRNLPFPFFGQNSITARSTADEPSKKKRGHPRKASADSNTGVASSERPSKKAYGRTPGFEKKKQQPETLGSAEFGSMHGVIHVNIGEDIVAKVMTFLPQAPTAISVLSATGFVRNVTLQQSAMTSGTVTHEGQFAIISLAGSLILSESNGIIGFLSVLLSRPDSEVFGGVVIGMVAASPVEVVVMRPQLSVVYSSNVDAAGPLSHEPGPSGNAAQPMHGVPPT